jgi:hypothetical protein
VETGAGNFQLPVEKLSAMRVDIVVPTLTREEINSSKPQEITVHAEMDGKSIGEIKMRVALQNGGVPE